MSRVREILSVKGDHVRTITPDTLLVRAAQRMRAEQVGAFVVSTDGERIEGLVAERDIVHALARHGASAAELAVSAVMTRAVITCAPNDTVRSVMTEMTRARVRHLPVVDGARLCGIISIGDVVKACIDDADLETGVIRDAYLAQRAGLANA